MPWTVAPGLPAASTESSLGISMLKNGSPPSGPPTANTEKGAPVVVV
jgi:hypothetical protein